MTIGRASASVKNGDDQSRLADWVTTALVAPRSSSRLALPTVFVIETDRAVSLGADGAGTDEDHVGQGAESPEDPSVGGPAQQAGPAVDADGSVEAGDHVAADEGPVVTDPGWDGIGGGGLHTGDRLWQEGPHAACPLAVSSRRAMPHSGVGRRTKDERRQEARHRRRRCVGQHSIRGAGGGGAIPTSTSSKSRTLRRPSPHLTVRPGRTPLPDTRGLQTPGRRSPDPSGRARLRRR